MCMEDIRLGRATGSFAQGVALLADTTTLLVPQDVNRTALTFMVRGVAPVLLGFEGINVSDNVGFLFEVFMLPYCFKIEDIGDVITGPIFVRAVGGVSSVAFIATTLSKR